MHDRLLDPDPSETSPSALRDRAVRALMILLPERDWQVLRCVEPDPLAWLRTQLQHRLDQSTPIDPVAGQD